MGARALAGVTFVIAIAISSTVQAQTIEPAAPSLKTTLTNAFLSVKAADVQLTAPIGTARPSPRRDAPRVSALALHSLYVTTATVQMLDVHSTVQAMSRGAVEANPLMAGLVQHRGAFVAAKAGVAAMTIYAARHLARSNKAGAIVAMVAINSAYAMIVANNYRNAR